MKKIKELLMVTVSGQDRPGITAAFTKILAENNVEIVDIEQASPQDLLGLYFLLDIKNAYNNNDSVIKELLYESNKLGLNLQFKLYSKNEIKHYSNKNLYIINLFGGTKTLSEVSKVLSEENINIESISTLYCFGQRTIEMKVKAPFEDKLSRFKRNLMLKSHELEFDISIQKLDAYRKNKRLIFFDMDSTLLDMEIIDEIAKKIDTLPEIARITQKAMRGDIEFEDALKQRIALIKGVSINILNDIKNSIVLSNGVSELIKVLKYLGYKIGIITGGFSFFADQLKKDLELDYSFANELEIKDEKITGNLSGPIIDAQAKARILNKTAFKNNIPLDQVVAIGDGANDSLMLGQAGLGIAYNAKKTLKKIANTTIQKNKLKNILILLGITEGDLEEVSNIIYDDHD
ncbi:phosphoserine phosphatase SerB [Thermodesulfobacteriota bacterium]